VPPMKAPAALMMFVLKPPPSPLSVRQEDLRIRPRLTPRAAGALTDRPGWRRC
jgi:hypothetical protein